MGDFFVVLRTAIIAPFINVTLSMYEHVVSCKRLAQSAYGLLYLVSMAQQKQKRSRTYARNRAASVSRRGYEKLYETDSAYFLKLVIVVLLGMFWVRFGTPIQWFGVPIGGVPVGLLAGLILIKQFEKYQQDRKIWYAILVIVAIVSNFLPTGFLL